MAANENQLDLIGRNIDRVVTVEARISGTSRNVIAHLYEAARLRQGGGPLSMLAARQILTHLGAGKTVFLTTGAGNPQFLPSGETDAPPGVAALAAAFQAATSARPDPAHRSTHHRQPRGNDTRRRSRHSLPRIRAHHSLHGAVLPLSHDATAEVEASGYLDRFKPAKLGPNPDGVAHSSTGKPTAGDRARAEALFDLAAARGIPTLGIGDNEIGFGPIMDAVRRHKPNGERLPPGLRPTCCSPPIRRTGAPMRSRRHSRQFSVDPRSCTVRRPSAGCCKPASTPMASTAAPAVTHGGRYVQAAIVTLLSCIVRNGLVEPFKRAF